MSDPASKSRGPLVTSPSAIFPDRTLTLTGKHVVLVPLGLSQVPSLYESLGGVANEDIYNYFSEGPFLTPESFTPFITTAVNDTTGYTWTVYLSSSMSDSSPRALGAISLYPVPAHHRVELGVMFNSAIRRSTAATECFYLVLTYAFSLHYLRVEWKCDTLNGPSCSAATRLGFVYEGTFRKHMVVKGRSRHTAWFSIMDDEWGLVGRALEMWLDDGNFEAGVQKKGLKNLRLEIGGK